MTDREKKIAEIQEWLDRREKSILGNPEEYRKINNTIYANSIEWLQFLLSELERKEETIQDLICDRDDYRNGYYEMCKRLDEENRRLLEERNGVLKKIGELDFIASGEPAMIFYEILVNLFEKNGGKNFLTITIEKPDKSVRYAITIQNLNGEISPSEKLQILEQQLQSAKQEIDQKNREITRSYDIINGLEDERQKLIERLRTIIEESNWGDVENANEKVRRIARDTLKEIGVTLNNHRE